MSNKIILNSMLPILISTSEFEFLEQQIKNKKSLANTILLAVLEKHREEYFKAKELNHSIPVYRGRDVPKPGDIIYVGTHWYIDRGQDDVEGGKAVVKEIEEKFNSYFVTVWEHPEHGYNWDSLLVNQAVWEKEFKDKWAYACPDYG